MEYGLKSAALVRLKAAELCPGGDSSCFPFHAIRPYLRLFGMVGGPGRNEAFFSMRWRCRPATGPIRHAF
jgi:hypothetical protein